jgi:hypothetical protein
MSLERQKELITSAGDLGLVIPGLALIAIIENIVEKSQEVKVQAEIIDKERKAKEEQGIDKEQAKAEAKEKRKAMIDKFKENIKDYVKEQIALIKQQYKIFMDGLKRIPEDVKTAIQNIALPPAITVPPGGPNPLYALNIAKQTKAALVGTLGIIVLAFTEVLKAATKILFVLPDSLLSTFEQIKTAFTIIKSIPV